nr:MAG TPA: Putative ATP dependent Clp protease [Caudoviricetes sp.]
MSNSKYWNIAVKEDNSDVADLYLYNIIDDFAYEGYTDSAESILKDINDLGNIKTLNVFINSPGGSVFEGISIKNMLERQKLRGCFINVVIDGLAASIASIIAMAGDKITMPENALMMIHRASCGCMGNADDFAKQIEVLNKIDLVLTNTYVTRSNGLLTEEDVTDMFNSGDTWLTAQEAKDFGLCDEITEKLEAVAKYEDCTNDTKVDMEKWSNKVDEWYNEISEVAKDSEEGGNEVDNQQPINVTINLDVQAILDALNPIKDEIANLKATIEATKIQNEAEEVEDGCKKKNEDDSEPIDEGEEVEDKVEVEDEVKDEVIDEVEDEVEDKKEDEEEVENKAEVEEQPEDELDINFFDNLLKDLM